MELTGVDWLLASVVSTNSSISLVILFSSQILKGSAMVYNTWSHWASGILNTRKHNVLGEEKTEVELDSFSEILFFFSI
jgi:hypothetical protein